jgi:hypothetical protein
LLGQAVDLGGQCQITFRDGAEVTEVGRRFQSLMVCAKKEWLTAGKVAFVTKHTLTLSPG